MGNVEAQPGGRKSGSPRCGGATSALTQGRLPSHDQPTDLHRPRRRLPNPLFCAGPGPARGSRLHPAATARDRVRRRTGELATLPPPPESPPATPDRLWRNCTVTGPRGIHGLLRACHPNPRRGNICLRPRNSAWKPAAAAAGAYRPADPRAEHGSPGPRPHRLPQAQPPAPPRQRLGPPPR